ncbi:hypothetical protein R3P38DRAFT_3395909 [Favolaschia claudopus]|uniref:Uncharacterized protein n=1 Tax=Favolaschia claudopus TaxID=2862362 RepID=A0AAW0BF81_9AGAR
MSAALLAFKAAEAQNTECTGTGMKWYHDMVGETPCQTYQKLRRICNAGYNVGVQNINTPPDLCDDQVSTCCCNTISFALSMLCLNCQQNISTGTGFDAGAGAYGIYTSSCSNPQSNKFPKDIQTAVCNSQIKIADDIYGNGWPDGAWFYIFTRDTLSKDAIVNNQNVFTHCPSTTINDTSSSSSSNSRPSSSSSSSPSPSSPPSSNRSTLATGAIAGISVGAAIVGLIAAFLLWLFCFHRRKTDARRAGVLEEPLGDGRRMSEREGRRGVLGAAFGIGAGRGGGGEGVVDESLVARSGGNNNNNTNTLSHSSRAPSEGGTSSSAPGFAGLGAGSAVGQGYAAYGNANANHGGGAGAMPTTPRGFHTAGQLSTSSTTSLSSGAPAVGAVGAGAVGSWRQQQGQERERERGQAGPLPRKRGGAARRAGRGEDAGAGGGGAAASGARSPSEEPFLEGEDERQADDGTSHGHGAWGSDVERHRDAGPVSDVSLGRSASGRLPPAYGEQI